MREESGSPRTELLKRQHAESKSSFCALLLRARPHRGEYKQKGKTNNKIALCKSPAERCPSHLAAKRTPAQLPRPPGGHGRHRPPDLHKEPMSTPTAAPRRANCGSPRRAAAL